MSTLTVFTAARQAKAHRARWADLRCSGFSLTRFVTHRADPEAIARAFADGKLRVITGGTSYESKLRSRTAVKYAEPLKLDSSAGNVFLNHRVRAASEIAQNVIWIDGSSVILCAVPLKFQVPDMHTAGGRRLVFSPNFYMQDALDLAGLVDLLTLTESTGFADVVAVASARSLEQAGLDVQGASSDMLNACAALDIWSLTGTVNRSDDAMFDGRTESAVYSWAIASLLNFTSDHVINHYFDLVSHEEVFDRVRQGYGFMQDHAIFTSAACVLELTHFGDWVPQRSWDRLERYGFDSSTMYLFAIALERNLTLRVVADWASEVVQTLSLASDEGDEEETQQHALRQLRVIDRAEGIQYDLRETRSQVIDAEFQGLLGDQSLGTNARNRVQEARDLALERIQRHEDTRTNHGTARLTFAAAVLAMAAIPSAVDVIWVWSDSQEWARLAVAGVGMVGALGLTFRALSHGRRRGVTGG